MLDTRFHIHTKNKQTKLYFCISESLHFWILNFFYRHEWSAAHQRQLLRLQGTACFLNRVLQAHCNFRLFYSSFEAKNGIIPSRVSLDNRIVRWKADVVRRSQPLYPIPSRLHVCGYFDYYFTCRYCAPTLLRGDGSIPEKIF
jgi:hypothetical protein